MKQIMSALCRAWKPEWQGLVMAELCYEEGQGEGFPREYEITISERRLVRVAAAQKETGEVMSMVLLPLRKGNNPEAAAESHGTPWRAFSADEVRAFSSALGDHNEIHQGARPIVSGFQILAALKDSISYKKLRIRFQRPLFAGEMVTLVEEAGALKGYAGALCFTCEEIK